jgi:two-component system chemotaxis family response regulator WspR
MEMEKAVIPCANEKGTTITISIGVSTQTPAPGKSIDHFVSLADSALHKAKQTGKNRVVFEHG